MQTLHHELDGRRFTNADQTQAWLIFHGLRHHIENSAVYESLFIPSVPFESKPDIETITEGQQLCSGTCLVSSDQSGRIYLVYGRPVINIRKYAIEDYDTFKLLGFNSALVRSVPDILLSAIPSGQPIRIEG